MRQILLIIVTFIFSPSFGQVSSFEFQVTDYNSNGSQYRQTTKKIESETDQLDLYFFRKYFFVPYYLPDKFIDENYKNKTMTVWRDENVEKYFKSNWTNTYIYDSLSRVISFSYSGCFVCSDFPYDYKVSYNDKGQVTKLTNDLNNKKKFEFKYDSQGNIIELKCFNFGELIQMIELK